MKENRTNIQEFLDKYEAGEFNRDGVDAMIKAGWYDWFCKDESLHSRLKPMAAFVKKIANSPKFDKTKNYVFFKNNCPMVGGLYDSFSICDLETGDAQYWIGFLNSGVYGKEGFRVEIAPVHSWAEEDKPTLVFSSRKDAADWMLGKIVKVETRRTE
jgi:hypothetical protein